MKRTDGRHKLTDNEFLAWCIVCEVTYGGRGTIPSDEAIKEYLRTIVNKPEDFTYLHPAMEKDPYSIETQAKWYWACNEIRNLLEKK
jgi:RecB family endonuclease NucS